MILAVAVGVGSLTGVRGFSRAFHDMLLRQARTLMAADLSLRVFELPTPEQNAVLDDLAKHGVQRTWITETLTMASAGANRSVRCWCRSKRWIRRSIRFTARSGCDPPRRCGPR